MIIGEPIMNKKIKAVIFDYGGVICHKQDDVNIGKMLNILGINKKDFFYLYKKHRHDYDRGLINSIDYWKRIIKEIENTDDFSRGVACNTSTSINKSMIEELIRIDIASWANINYNMIELIKKIRSHFDKIAILSNMHFDFLDFLKKNNNWFNIFDERFFSCDLKLAKPDLSIFKYCMDKLNVNAADCLFIDDTEENIAAAGSIEMKTILYRSFDDFKKELYGKYISN